MRILIITDLIPYPPISGTALRLYNLLRRITKEHEVWLLTFVETPDEVKGVSHLLEFCRGVETVNTQQLGALARPIDLFRYLVTGKPPDLRFYYPEELIRKVQYLFSRVNFDLVEIVNSYMAMALQALPQKMHGKTLLTFIDIVFSRSNRVYQIEPRPTRKLRIWLHSRMMRWWEPRYAERFGRCITVSEVDRHLLLAANPRLQVDTVPNGIDTQIYRPLPYKNTRPTLIFVGDMIARPNIDAVMYFCREVLPRVRQVITDVEMWVVGKNPGDEVRQLNGDGIYVTGRVDDIRPYYSKSTVCVVPLRAGGGTRLKILEAMALGRPVISTSIGCEGLDVIDDEHLFIADNPEEFAAKTVRFLTDRVLCERITSNARQLVVTHYDWDVIARKLMQIYLEVAE